MADTQTGRTLREIVRILARRFLGMVLIFAILLAGMGAATYLLPRTYRSQVRILAKPSRDTSPLELAGADLRNRVSLFVTTQREIILSDYVVASALLALEGKPIPAYVAGQDAATRRWDQAVQAYISGDPGKGIPGHREYLREVSKRIDVVTPGGPDATFSQTLAIRVDWPEESDRQPKVFLLTSNAASRELAAKRAHDLAHFLVQAYLARYTRLETEETRKASAFFTENALVDAKAALDKAIADLDQFSKQVKGDLLAVINLTSRYTAGTETGVASLTTRFQGETDTVQDDLAETQELLAIVQTQLAKPNITDIVVPDAITDKSPSLKTIQDKIVSLKLSLTNLRARYTEGYQQVQDTVAELRSAQEELQAELKRQQERLAQKSRVLEARFKKLQEIVDKHRTRADELAAVTGTYERLRNALIAAQDIYDKEKQRVVSAATAEKLAANPILVQVLDEPSYPDPAEPHRPVVWANMLVAGIAGLVLALVYAFVADHFDHAIKSVDDAERFLHSPVLGSVPKLGRRIIRHRARAGAPRAPGVPAPVASVKRSAEEVFGGLWASLFYSGEAIGKSVLVCSAGRQEGSTTIAVGLALAGSSPAATGSVALVDLNLRNPAVHELLGIQAGSGVAGVILEGLPSESAAQPVSLGLDAFCLGNVGGRVLELLRSQKLPAFLKGLEARYDHVLVDAAPVNRFPDAQVLARAVRDVVLVAHTDQTPRQALALAKKRLEAGGAHLAGVVLNLRSYPIPKFLYRRV